MFVPIIRVGAISALPFEGLPTLELGNAFGIVAEFLVATLGRKAIIAPLAMADA
jgi:hypothetical protein